MWQNQPPFPPELRQTLEELNREAGASVQALVSNAPPSRDSNEWHRSWHFPTEAAAVRWNDEWDRVLERLEISHPALTHIAGSVIADRFLDGLARLAGAILSEEVHAGTPCPYMTPGWRYDLLLQHSIHTMRASEMEQPLVVKIVGEVRSDDDELRWTSDTTRVYPSDRIASPLAAVWSACEWSPVDETYG